VNANCSFTIPEREKEKLLMKMNLLNKERRFFKSLSKGKTFDNALEAFSLLSKSLCHFDFRTVRKDYKAFHDYLLNNYGKRHTVTCLKAFYSEAVKYSIGDSVPGIMTDWYKRDKDNFICRLKSLKPLLVHNDVIITRMTLTMLRSYEAIELPLVPDLSTVTLPSKGAEGFKTISDHFRWFLNDSSYALSIKEVFNREKDAVKEKLTSDDLPFSTKKGPNGPTCTTGAHQAMVFDDDKIDLLSNLANFTRKGDFGKVIRDQKDYIEAGFPDLCDRKTKDRSKQFEGRITFVPAPGGKSRLVALGNYWLQESLRGLHKVIYRVLSTLPQDGTYKQESQFDRCLAASKIGPCWSYDLTAATDRFPLEIQESVLEFLDPDLASVWSETLRSLTFEYEGQSIKYQVGHPMGVYSCWAIFTLTHHFVVQYAARLAGYTYFSDYAMLGDDICIWNSGVASKYEGLIKLLDVSISIHKSFIPRSLTGPCNVEFAKRIGRNGVEITGVSPKQNIDAWSSYKNWPNFASWLVEHNFILGSLTLQEILKLARLTKSQSLNLCLMIYVWELLRHPTFVGLTDFIPEEYLSKLTAKRLIEARLELLTDQSSDLMSDLFDIEEQNKEDLANFLVVEEAEVDEELLEGLYFTKVLATRLKQIEALDRELSRFIPDEFALEEQEPDPDDPESGTNHLPSIREIEFLPKVKFEDLIQDIYLEGDRKTLRSRFLIKVLNKLLGITLTQPVLNQCEPEEGSKDPDPQDIDEGWF
jgi:hypothetical protein